MDLTLNFYGFAPNRSGETHYLFKAKNKYLEKISEDLVFSVSQPETFRFEAGSIVADLTGVDSAKVSKACYVVAFNADYSFFKCYFVETSDYRNGIWYFAISPDYWGTYIDVANIRDIYVSKSNKNLGKPHLEPINAIVEGESAAWKQCAGPFAITDLVVVLQVALQTYAAKETIGIAQEVSTTKLLAFSPNSLSQSTSTGTDYLALHHALINAGTLYQWKTGTGIFENYNDAKVLRGWALPRAWLQIGSFGTGDARFTFMSPEASQTLEVRIGDAGGEVLPAVVDGAVDLGLTEGNLIENRIVFGTRSKQVELPRNLEPEARFRVTASASGVKVCIVADGKETDVSEAFEATLSSDENMYTTTQQIVKAFNFLSNGFISAAKAYKKGGEANTLASLVSTWGGGIETALSVEATSRNATGDAENTYIDYHGNAFHAQYPFGYYLQPSDANEMERVSMDGANFETYLGEGKTLYDLNGNAFIADVSGQDVLVKGSCKASGAPSMACDIIEAELAKGLYYVVVDG